MNKEYLRFFIVILLGCVVLYFLKTTASVFLLAWLVAILLEPLVSWLRKGGVREWVLFSSITTAIIFTITILAIWIVPILIDEFSSFFDHLPQIIDDAFSRILALLRRFDAEISDGQFKIATAFENFFKGGLGATQGVFGNLSTFFYSSFNFVLGTLNIILFPIFVVYLLLEMDSLSKGFDRIVPSDYKDLWIGIKKRSLEIFRAYFKGMLIVCLFLSISYSIGLVASGIRFGLLIGVLGGALSIVPYLGALLGFSAATLMALAESSVSWKPLLGVLITFAIVQTIESYFITPTLVGRKVGLNPLAAILCIIVGGNAGGLTGMILSIPVAALISEYVLTPRPLAPNRLTKFRWSKPVTLPKEPDTRSDKPKA